MKTFPSLTAAPLSFALVSLALLTGCGKSGDAARPGGEKQLTDGVAFETLQTEYWVAGFESIKAELKKRNINVVEAIADGDANRQLQQVRTFITRKVGLLRDISFTEKNCNKVFNIFALEF